MEACRVVLLSVLLITNRIVKVGLQELILGQLALPVGGEPDLGQGALLGEDGLGVEHGSAVYVCYVALLAVCCCCFVVL